MSQSHLCIDLQSDLLTAVLFESGKSLRVLDSTVVVTGQREPGEIVAELAESIDCAGCRASLAVGVSFVLFQNLEFPFSDHKSIDKILPFELEDNLIKPVEMMVVDTYFRPAGAAREVEVIAAMLEREVLDPYHHAFQEAGVFLERITLSGQPSIGVLCANGKPPETFIFLSLCTHDAGMFFYSSGSLQLIRPLPVRVMPDSENGASFVFNRDTGTLESTGLEHGAESFRELARGIRRTLLPFMPDLDFTKIPIYVEGSGILGKESAARMEEGFGTPCFICGRGGILPLPLKLPVRTEAHAELCTSCFSLAAQPEKKHFEFNFCKEGFALGDRLARYGIMAKILGGGLLLGFVAVVSWLFYDISKMQAQQDGLKSEINTIFHDTLPGVSRIVDPVQQLQVAIDGLKLSSGDDGETVLPYTSLHVLREISAHIPPSIDVLLTRLVYDNKGVRLVGMTDNFNSVDGIKKSLEKSAEIRGVTINSTNQDQKNNKIRFELKIVMDGGE